LVSQGAVQVRLELGHRAQVRKKPTAEGFTHDWMVFVRGPDHCNIQHFVEKVVFHLHESFPKPKRVCKDPPFKVEESGYAGFILPIEVYFKNKEEPKKVRFDYDLFLHLEGHPPVNHLRCEKLTFNNPTEEFRRKLLKAGGKGLTPVFSSSFTATGSSQTRFRRIQSKIFSSRVSSLDSSSFPKLHKPSKDQKAKAPKEVKEPKSAFRDSSWDTSKTPKESSRKPKENQPLRDSNPKMGFKEPKTFCKEHRSEGMLPGSGANKRLPGLDSNDPVTKKRRKGYLDSSGKTVSGSDAQHSDKKRIKDRLQMGSSKYKADGEEPERRRSSALPFQEAGERHESDMEEQSIKSDVSGAHCSYTTVIMKYSIILGPLQSVMQEPHTDEEDSEDEDDNDMDSDGERFICVYPALSRVSLSDGSESDTSPPPSHKDTSALLKSTNNQILEVKSPIRQNKQDKSRNLDCDKAYLDELVELHKRLMTLREGHILQQIVNLIEETGHFHITNTTFDFDLCSLDRSTVRKLQSYLETSGLS
uniref:MLLT3 super elongation complex subunit n=1 Tax=Oryzias melastigma TaxID=30732 RepID=A0A3B3BFC9_ORYME